MKTDVSNWKDKVIKTGKEIAPYVPALAIGAGGMYFLRDPFTDISINFYKAFENFIRHNIDTNFALESSIYETGGFSPVEGMKVGLAALTSFVPTFFYLKYMDKISRGFTNIKSNIKKVL